MNCLDTKARASVVNCLIEGCSIRATVRMTGISKTTIMRLLADLGTACAAYHDHYVRNLRVRRLQADEIWQFVGCKQKQVTLEKIERDGVCGDVWTWTAIEAETKLVPCWLIGKRDGGCATIDVPAPALRRVSHRPRKSPCRFNRLLFGSFKPRAFASLGKAPCDCV